MANEDKKIAGSAPTPSARFRADRKAIAFRMHLEGFELEQIVDAIKAMTGSCAGKSYVQGWITEAIEAARLARPEFLKVSVNVELEKIDNLERQYWAAWHRSCADKTKTRKTFDPPLKSAPPTLAKKRGRPKASEPPALLELGELKGVIVETETQNGDIKFLLGVQWCVEQRLKLNGTSAPKENKIGGDVEDPESESLVAQTAEQLGPRKIIFRTVGGDKKIG